MEGTPRGVSQEEACKIVRELNTHQIELELQNENLRQAQIELERSCKKINDLYEFAPVSYLTVSDTGIVIEANLTAAEMLGVEKMNLLNTPFSKFILEEYQNTYYLCRRAILETKTSQCVELQMKKEGGDDFWGSCECKLIKDSGDDIYIRTVISDISKRKQAELALQRVYTELESKVQERTRQLAKANRDLQNEIVEHHVARRKLEEYVQRQKVMNALLQISIDNCSLEEMLNRIINNIIGFPGLGLEPSGVIFLKKKTSEYLVMKAHVNVPEDLVRVCSSRQVGECLCGRAALSAKVIFATSLDASHEISYQGMDPHGHYCVPILGTDGKVLGVLALFLKVDTLRNKVVEETLVASGNVIAGIIERTRAKIALRKKNDELEKRVEQRTLELQKTQQQLLHVEKLSAIGRLSASIAHEFNNPLQGILTVLNGVAKRSSLEEEDMRLVLSAREECQRIKGLIRDLQDFNRPTSGKKELMDLRKAIDILLLLCKSDCKHRKVTVVTKYAENTPSVMVVLDQIKQVVLNLLRNAMDACPDGGTIYIDSWSANDELVLQVQDTGIGIKPENLDRIFEPFFTTKSEIKGTGLGLSTSYGIIKKHNGRLEVKSELGKGTTFTIALPAPGASDDGT